MKDALIMGRAAAPAVTFASAGFAAVAPDYLGMGLGPGPHPYLDISTETEHCRAWFAANRVDAPLVDVGTLNHDGSVHLGANILGVTAVAAWFGTLR